MIETHYVMLTFCQTCNFITCDITFNPNFYINNGLIYTQIIVLYLIVYFLIVGRGLIICRSTST